MGVPVTLTNKAYEILGELLQDFLKEKFFNTCYQFLEKERNREQIPRIEVQKGLGVLFISF
jgi:hypothetical protein